MYILSDKKVNGKLKQAAYILWALDHPVRKKIIGAIASDPPMNVNQISAIIKLTQPKCSMHLAILKKADLVTCAPAIVDKRMMMYDVAEDRIDNTIELLDQIIN